MKEGYQDWDYLAVNLHTRTIEILRTDGGIERANEIVRGILRNNSALCMGWKIVGAPFRTKFLGMPVQRVLLYYVLPLNHRT